MRIAVYVGKMRTLIAPAAEGEDLVRAVAGAGERLDGLNMTWVEEWEDGGDVLTASDCLVVVGPKVTRADLPDLPEPGNGATVRLPVVVVTSDVCAAAITLRTVPVQEIVEGDPDAVAQAIRRAAESSIFFRATRVLDDHPRFSMRLRAWLKHTLLADPPFSTVTDSAKDAPWRPSTIRADWGAEIGVSSPKEWISMIQFARAIRLGRGSTWAQTANRLGVSRRTLERRAKRVTGRSLSELTYGPSGFDELFEAYLARIVTGSPD